MRLVLAALSLVGAACSSSSPDAGPAEAGVDAFSGSGNPCTVPAGCAASEVCCGTIPITGGTAPDCTTGTISSVCRAAGVCATHLGSTCSGTQTVRVCTVNSDCTEKLDNLCCTFGDADAGGALSFCASAFIAAFGGGKCM